MTQFYRDLPAEADPHMRGPLVGELLGSVGAQLDAMAEQVMQARLRGNPFAGGPTLSREGAARLVDGRLIECEEWVLPLHAAQRGVRLYSTESVLSKRIRIARHLDYKRMRGTLRGLLLNAQPYFVGLGVVPTMRAIHRLASGKCVWHTLYPDGTYEIKVPAVDNWNFGGSGRSRFWVGIYTKDPDGVQVPTLGPAATYDDGIATYDDGVTVYDGLSYAVAADLVALSRDHAAHSKCAGVMLWSDTADFQPSATPATDGDAWTTLPDSGNWLSTVYTSGSNIGLASRNPRAFFLYDNP
jgi:hypothetical protein